MPGKSDDFLVRAGQFCFYGLIFSLLVVACKLFHGNWYFLLSGKVLLYIIPETIVMIIRLMVEYAMMCIAFEPAYIPSRRYWVEEPPRPAFRTREIVICRSAGQ